MHTQIEEETPVAARKDWRPGWDDNQARRGPKPDQVYFSVPLTKQICCILYSKLIRCFYLDVSKALFTRKRIRHLPNPYLHVSCQLIKELREQAATVKGDSLEALR